jgi:hypothetical protein
VTRVYVFDGPMRYFCPLCFVTDSHDGADDCPVCRPIVDAMRDDELTGPEDVTERV